MRTLLEIFARMSEWSDKVTRHTYVPVYEVIFAPLRFMPIRLIEVGVERGGSLAAWSEYFTHPSAHILGIDVVDCRERITGTLHRDRRVQFVQEDARRFDYKGMADIVIDDGDHDAGAQGDVFAHLSPRLSPNGIYIIEDVQGGPGVSMLCHRFPGRFVVLDRNVFKTSEFRDDIMLLAGAG